MDSFILMFQVLPLGSFQLYGIGLYPYMQTHCFQLRNSNEKQKNGELEIIYLSKHTTD